MRLTFNMQFTQGLNGILNTQKKMSVAENQLTKQTRIITPADDPAGSAKVLGLDQNLSQIEQFQKNSILLKNGLALEETILTNMRVNFDRISQLAIASGNGTFTLAERQAVALELENIQTEFFDLMNTRDSDGGYIFAGFQDKSPAYELNPTTGRYEFKGDDGSRRLQISPSISLSGRDSGKLIFDDVFARFKPTTPVVVSGTPDSVALRVSDQQRFDQFFRENFDSLNPANNLYSVQIDAASNYQILNNGNPLSPPVTGVLASGEPIQFAGLELQVNGAAAAPSQIDFTLPTPEKKNILDTLSDFISALRDPLVTGVDFNEAIADILVQTDNSARNVDNTLASIGGRVNVLDSVFSSNEDLIINNKGYKADISEVDFVAALTEIKRQEIALQAVSTVFSKIGTTTLFDYLR
jgi:flagellar hook-associated protein 3 FlgL